MVFFNSKVVITQRNRQFLSAAEHADLWPTKEETSRDGALKLVFTQTRNKLFWNKTDCWITVALVVVECWTLS